MTAKYRAWYDLIIDRARNRDIPTCYTEVHHIKPRALGGGDDADNLVRLTFREHFLVHWLLVRICSGDDLRRMRFALNAMTMPIGRERLVVGWQIEAAKRSIRDLADSDEVQAASRRSYLDKKEILRNRAHEREVERRSNKRALLADAPILAAQARTKNDLANLATRMLKRGKPPRDFISPNASPEAKCRHAMKARKVAEAAFPDAF